MMHLSHHMLAAGEALGFLSRESREFVMLSKQKYICIFMFSFTAQTLQQFC